MIFILQTITESRIRRLIDKRDIAIRNKDYDQAWLYNLKIDKNINRLTTLSY